MTAPTGTDRRIAILGAGPIGLETALYAIHMGYDVVVYERGRLGENVRQWGHIRLFSHWAYNRSPLGVKRLRDVGHASAAVDESACPTGEELARDYLEPLAALPEMRGIVREQHHVLGCARSGILKKTMGADNRGQHPFVILLRGPNGAEHRATADIVIDTTGVYGNHNYLGDGGIPAIGESDLVDDIDYFPPDIMGADRQRFAQKHTVVVGSGFSGATSAVALATLMEDNPGTTVTWVCRTSQATPLTLVPDDPLADRSALTARANGLAAEPPPGFRYLSSQHVLSVAKPDGQFSLQLLDANDKTHEVRADALIANVGYRPDETVYRQLHVHECYATLGPIDLAASLLGSENVDCLAIQAGGADLLRNPEPNFFILGAKSYGTNPSFILRLGQEHIVQLFSLLSGDEAVNLYAA